MVFSSQPGSLYGPSLRKKYGCQYISKADPEADTIRQLADFMKGRDPMPVSEPVKRNNPFMLLSDQERDVALYWFMGWRTDPIAEKLGIKSASVRSVKRRILEKTGARDLEALKELANQHPKG
jgi:DNA-binding NarL/FixJ family response regulator